jgi:hypothetical protein
LSFLLFASCSLALAGEFLGIIPNSTPQALSSTFTVIGQTDNGVLVIADDARSSDLTVLKGRYLDDEPRSHEYYRVHLFSRNDRARLAELGTILDFDGQEYVVRMSRDAVPEANALPAMVARVSLKPLVLKATAPELPRVFANPTIQAIVNAVEPDSILAAVRRLQNYRSRYSTGDSARAAAQWIAAKFRAYGCDSVYLQNHTSGYAPNVVGIKYGTSGQRNPYAIIDGHFDSYAQSNAPGADDNASGTVSAIEACRVMRNYQFIRDIRYIAFSGEEQGLYGSDYYATDARSHNDSIMGVFNFDMIAYVDVAPENLDMVTKTANPPCRPFADFFTACADTYTTLTTNIQMVSDNQNSDHGPFWNNGYVSFCGIEDFWPVNPWYHTPGDSIGAGYNNNAFCTEVIKAGVASLATICEPVPMNIPMVGYLHNRLDDPSGNHNHKWDAGESVAVAVTLKNFGLAAAHNVTASIQTSDPYVTLYQTDASYGDLSGSDTAVGSVPYTMKAAPNTPREHMVNFDLTITATESTWRNSFSLQVGEYLITDPVPDGPRTPPLYWAYDDVDAAYPEHPTYDWVEIKTIGTRLSYPQNDNVVMVNLPTGFGPLKFYGTRYSQVSVSADGWICPGNYTTSNYSNTGLPNSATPPGVICLNWDDLYPEYSSQGYVYYYHDAANLRFVIEYDSVSYYSPTSLRDKFELIIYDTTVVTPTGNNALVAQYMTANGYTSSTVGIEDPTRAIAIQDCYNGTLAHGAAPIAAGRAIKYTTITPSAILEPLISDPRPLTPSLAVVPSPMRSLGTIMLDLSSAGPVDIGVYDGAGRRIRTIAASAMMKAGSYAFPMDARGLPGGVYFVRLSAGGARHTSKVVVATQ